MLAGGRTPVPESARRTRDPRAADGGGSRFLKRALPKTSGWVTSDGRESLTFNGVPGNLAPNCPKTARPQCSCEKLRTSQITISTCACEYIDLPSFCRFSVRPYPVGSPAGSPQYSGTEELHRVLPNKSAPYRCRPLCLPDPEAATPIPKRSLASQV